MTKRAIAKKTTVLSLVYIFTNFPANQACNTKHIYSHIPKYWKTFGSDDEKNLKGSARRGIEPEYRIEPPNSNPNPGFNPTGFDHSENLNINQPRYASALSEEFNHDMLCEFSISPPNTMKNRIVPTNKAWIGSNNL
jgi:hypothetical protein